MADNELDKSIEELEAEVLAELELDEANGQDAPKKGAAPAEKMDKAEAVSYTHLTLPTNREV